MVGARSPMDKRCACAPCFRATCSPTFRRPWIYDLRLAESRQAQADLAKGYGIEAFCYWHYWFAGRRILERPYEEELQAVSPTSASA